MTVERESGMSERQWHISCCVARQSWGHSSKALLGSQALIWYWLRGYPTESPSHVAGFTLEPSRAHCALDWNLCGVFLQRIINCHFSERHDEIYGENSKFVNEEINPKTGTRILTLINYRHFFVTVLLSLNISGSLWYSWSIVTFPFLNKKKIIYIN